MRGFGGTYGDVGRRYRNGRKAAVLPDVVDRSEPETTKSEEISSEDSRSSRLKIKLTSSLIYPSEQAW